MQDPPLYVLSEADRALIAQATIAFRHDPDYLVSILWAARTTRDTQAQAAEQAAAKSLARVGVLEPRLLKYIEQHPDGCFVWVGSLTGAGQPVLRLGPEGKIQQVRRWLFEQTRRPIPAGRRALSGDGCELRCVRPEHTLVLYQMKTRNRRK